MAAKCEFIYEEPSARVKINSVCIYVVSGVGVAAPEEPALFWEYRAGDGAAFLTVGRPRVAPRVSFGARRLAGLSGTRSGGPSPPSLSLCNNSAVRRAETQGGQLRLETPRRNGPLGQTRPRQKGRGFGHTRPDRGPGKGVRGYRKAGA